MPKAEFGSTKWVANHAKSKGLQRLRWYCQVCEKQCRDENGFKCHTQSESHVRAMNLVGEDPRKAINEYSQQFQRAFLQQLKTAHGTKPIKINYFYQEYIQDKEHIHMNATHFKSLTEFAKHLGREGICRVEETEEDGIKIAWIDNSPEALRRQAAVQKQERMQRNDEQWEQRMLREQIRKAKEQAQANGVQESEKQGQDLVRKEGERVTFAFGAKQNTVKPPTPPQSDGRSSSEGREKEVKVEEDNKDATPAEIVEIEQAPKKAPMKISLGGNNGTAPKQKPRSMAALFGGKKTGSSTAKRPVEEEQPKKMSEAERVMREDMERSKGSRFSGVGHGPKRMKFG